MTNSLACRRDRLATGGSTSPPELEEMFKEWEARWLEGCSLKFDYGDWNIRKEIHIFTEPLHFWPNHRFSPLRSWSHQNLSTESTYYLVVLTDSKYKIRRVELSTLRILVLSHFTIILLASWGPWLICCKQNLVWSPHQWHPQREGEDMNQSRSL